MNPAPPVTRSIRDLCRFLPPLKVRAFLRPSPDGHATCRIGYDFGGKAKRAAGTPLCRLDRPIASGLPPPGGSASNEHQFSRSGAGFADPADPLHVDRRLRPLPFGREAPERALS